MWKAGRKMIMKLFWRDGKPLVNDINTSALSNELWFAMNDHEVATAATWLDRSLISNVFSRQWCSLSQMTVQISVFFQVSQVSRTIFPWHLGHLISHQPLRIGMICRCGHSNFCWVLKWYVGIPRSLRYLWLRQYAGIPRHLYQWDIYTFKMHWNLLKCTDIYWISLWFDALLQHLIKLPGLVHHISNTHVVVRRRLT